MSNNNKLDNPRTSTLAGKIGTIVGTVMVICVAACLVALCITLTYRAISWML